MKQSQKRVDEFMKRIGEDYWSPLSMLACIIEEAGELAREVNCLHGEKAIEESFRRKEKKLDRMEEELGDLLFAVMCMANFMDIDLDVALENTMKKYGRRRRGITKTSESSF